MVQVRAVEEGRFDDTDGFDDVVIRNRFIRKVYSILFCQLTFTTIVLAICIFVEPMKHYIKHNRGLLFVAMGVFLVTYFMLVCPCCMPLHRSFPANMIILAILTVAQSFMVAVYGTFYAPFSVFAALVATLLIVLGLTLFAIQTKYDFTSCAGAICMLSLFFMAFSVVVSIIYATSGFNRSLDIVYCFIGLLVAMIYIIVDTQMIVGGKHREIQLSPEDYIFATVMLYVDIIQIFLFILRLFGQSDE